MVSLLGALVSKRREIDVDYCIGKKRKGMICTQEKEKKGNAEKRRAKLMLRKVDGGAGEERERGRRK